MNTRNEGSNVFISYRHADSLVYAGRIVDNIKHHFGDSINVFRDIDAINAGRSISSEIERAISSCRLVIVLIGKDFLNLKNDDGTRRIDDPNDSVHVEIGSALKQGKVVLPVIIQDGHMPSKNELPAPLRELNDKKAIITSEENWTSDIKKVLKEIEQHLDVSLGLGKNRKTQPAALAIAALLTWFILPLWHFSMEHPFGGEQAVYQTGGHLTFQGQLFIIFVCGYALFSIIDQFKMAFIASILALVFLAFLWLNALSIGVPGFGLIGVTIFSVMAFINAKKQKSRLAI